MKPIKVDGNLFSGFLTAFQSFQKEIFPSQNLKHIDFKNERLLFLQDKYFSIIIRDQLEKPVERSIMQLANVAKELTNAVEEEPVLYHFFSDNKVHIVSLNDIESVFNPKIEEQLNMLNLVESQISKFDALTIVQVLKEFIDLLLIVFDKKFLFNFGRTKNNFWLHELLISDQNIDFGSIPEIDYKNLNSVVGDFVDQLNDSLKLYGKNDEDFDIYKLNNKIIRFLGMNCTILDRYGILNKILSGPLRYFSIMKPMNLSTNDISSETAI